MQAEALGDWRIASRMSDSGVPQRHVFTHPSKVEHWRHVSEIAALGIAALWALYVFVYQEEIKPARESPEVFSVWNVDHQPLPSGAELVRADFVSKNVGTQTLYVAGAIVSVYGVRFGTTPREWGVPLKNGFGVFNRSLPETSSTLLYSYVHTFPPFHGTAAAEAYDVQPQAEINRKYSFAIPAHTYDVARLEWAACMTKYPNRTWPVTVFRKPDGSYGFAGTAGAVGLVCYSSIHDEFPL